MSNKGIISVPMILTEQQERDILRFYDTCEDGQGYDVPKERMKSLARLGLIRPTGFSRYEITDAGNAVIEGLRVAPSLESLNKCGVQVVDCPECSHQWDHFFECGNRPARPQGGPVASIELVENKIYGGMHIVKWDNLGALTEGVHFLYSLPTSQVAPAAWEDQDGALHTTLESAEFSRRPIAPLYRHPPEQITMDDREELIGQLADEIGRLGTCSIANRDLFERVIDANYRKQVAQ